MLRYSDKLEDYMWNINYLMKEKGYNPVWAKLTADRILKREKLKKRLKEKKNGKRK